MVHPGDKIHNRSYFKIILQSILLTGSTLFSQGLLLPLFSPTGIFDEQELWIKNELVNVTICINAPLHFSKKGGTFLVLYGLANGNSIEWTKDEKMFEKFFRRNIQYGKHDSQLSGHA